MKINPLNDVIDSLELKELFDKYKVTNEDQIKIVDLITAMWERAFREEFNKTLYRDGERYESKSSDSK